MTGRSYDTTAEFYDLLHAAGYRRLVWRLLRRWLGRPALGVLDVGAGTGLATEWLASHCAVPVYAVEPAPAMRAVLLSRLAGRPRLLSRVTVHAMGMDQLSLADAVDFALCLNLMGTLDRLDRAAVLRSLSGAVRQGGRLLVQRPSEQAGAARADLPSRRLGPDTYGGEVTCSPAGPDQVLWRFAYRVTRDDLVVREATETFPGYLASAADFAGELRAAGFEPVRVDQPQIVLAIRGGGKSDPELVSRPATGQHRGMAKTTWKPYNQRGQLDSAERNQLPDSAYAFPGKRKEPLTDARHVRNAVARFDQVQDVTDAEREQAFANIQKAAQHYGVELSEESWHSLGKP